jgi:hypothetical protein
MLSGPTLKKNVALTPASSSIPATVAPFTGASVGVDIDAKTCLH